MRQSHLLLATAWLTLAALSVASLVVPLAARAQPQPAGEVIFVTAGVVAVDPSGARRTLDKGAALEEGDTVLTGDGRVQIRFKDGASVALQPGTQFKVDRYRYLGAGDDEDGVVMSLIKGSLRTISGLVGKRDHSAYRMNAVVATIGIRGTDYALELNGGLIGHVTDGAIEVCNGGGCLLVPMGQAFTVPSLSAPPSLSERRAFLPPAPGARSTAAKAAAVSKDHGQSTDDAPADTASADDSNGNAAAKARAAGGVKAVSVDDDASASEDADRAVLPSSAASASTTLPPGQAKKLEDVSLPLNLSTPGASRDTEAVVQLPSPGQANTLERTDSGALALPAGASSTLPPGQAKKLEAVQPAQFTLPGPAAEAAASVATSPATAPLVAPGISGKVVPRNTTAPGQLKR